MRRLSYFILTTYPAHEITVLTIYVNVSWRIKLTVRELLILYQTRKLEDRPLSVFRTRQTCVSSSASTAG